MRIAIAFFSYAVDEDLLRLAVQGAKRLQGRNGCTIDIYVYDQDDRPLSAPPEGVEYTRTTFNRGGNLNGLECVEAMAAIYAALGMYYDWIIKADSDAMIRDLEWVLAFDPAATSMVGSSYREQKHIHGSCYAVSADGAQAMLQALTNPQHREDITRIRCEDASFTFLADACGIPPARYIIDERGLTYKPREEHPLAYAIICKPITSCRPRRYCAHDRASAISLMRELLAQ